MKKVVFVQGALQHYRVALFNELSKKYDITVIHSGQKICANNCTFKELIVSYQRFGPFRLQRKLLLSIKQCAPSVVVLPDDFRWISVLFVRLLLGKCKYIWWGLDEGSSKLIELVKTLFIKQLGDNVVFYTENKKQRFVASGLSDNKCFVANNSFDVSLRHYNVDLRVKNLFINVGRLNKRKQNDVLIKSFDKVLQISGDELFLVLIGEGSEKQRLVDLAMDIGVSSNIKFIGQVNDQNVLSYYYQYAIASVSFGQAGLAVLQSMAFGVPFITKKNAISGGEIKNIQHNVNGLLCEDSEDSLSDNMLRLLEEPELAKRLGLSAFEHYEQKCSISSMANGFVLAIE